MLAVSTAAMLAAIAPAQAATALTTIENSTIRTSNFSATPRTSSTITNAAALRQAAAQREPMNRQQQARTGVRASSDFEIQDLMSPYNQAETLSSNVQKKLDETATGQQQKIGG